MLDNQWPDETPMWLIYLVEIVFWVLPIGSIIAAVIVMIDGYNNFAYSAPNPHGGLDNWQPLLVLLLLVSSVIGLCFRIGGR